MPPAEIASFLPAHLLAHLAVSGAPTGPVERRRDAAVLIADVVGFSILAERLAQAAGNASAEELTRRIDACLAPVVDGIVAHGGDVLGFAGDAVLAAWHGGPSGGAALARAAACALDLPRAVRPPEGEPLGLRMGLAAGEIVEDIVGGHEGRWLHVVRGGVFEELRGVLAETDPGEIRVGRASWPQLAPVAEADAEAACSVRLLRVDLPPGTERPALVVRPPDLDPAALSLFVPRLLLDRLDGGPAGWVAELRRVTVAFVRIGELSGGEASLARVQETTLALQAAVDGTEGVVLQLAVDEKGAMLLAAWGLPGATHEDDAARGALAALRIRESLGALGVATTVGVATGRVFCGLRGSTLRREYGVLGAVVNLAARLMGAAGDDGVLCDEATVREAGERVHFDAPRTRIVKGRDEPVSARTPLAGRARPARRGSSLLGRRDERDAFDGLLDDARGGQGATLVLQGDAGMGKSALLRQLAATAAERGARWISGWGDALERTTSCFAWRPVIAALLGAGTDVPARIARLGLDPSLSPLLAPMLVETLAETASTRALNGAPRAESTARLLAAICGATARNKPLVLAIDDAHWLDSASWLALQRLCVDAPPLVLVIATRPTDVESLRAIERGARVLPLAPMGPADLRTVLATRLGVADVDDALLAAVDTRAQGNPFYAEEIALALREGGHVTIVGNAARLVRAQDALQSLPSSLEGIVTSRIDRLPVPVQTTLKAASIAGAAFHADLLAAVHPARPAADVLAAHLDELQRGDLAVLDPVEPGVWRFRHRVVQEAAYGLLLLEQRRSIHRAVALEVERIHATALAPYFGVLAEHWIRAGETTRAVDALERAGDQAHAAWANVEAVGFYERALGLAAEEVSAARKGGWLRRLGDARHQLGDLAASRVRAEEALSSFGRPLPQTPAARAWALVQAVTLQARYQLRPVRAFPPPGESVAIGEAALALGLVSTAGFWKGDIWALVYGTVAGANLTERLPPSGTRAIGYAGLALVCGAIPLHGLAERYGKRAVAVSAASGDPDAVAYAHMMYGLYLFGAARLPDARAHVDDAAAGYRELGHARRVEECLTLLFADAWIRDESLAEIEAIAKEMCASARRRDDPQTSASGAAMRAMVADRAGDLDRAWSLWQGTRYPDSDRLNQLWRHGRIADLALRRGDPDRARDEAKGALALLRESTTMAANLFEAAMHAARVLARLDERGDARALLAIMRRYGRVFPVWVPSVRLVEAEIARAGGASSAPLFARARDDARRIGLGSVAALAETAG